MISISQEAGEKVIAGIRIPPRPGIVMELMEARNSDAPDLKKIARIVAKDVVLSAAMLKTVNSPHFGLRRKIDSIEQAVITMGSDNVINILTGLALRGMSGNTPQLNWFWDNAVSTASLAALIAKYVPGISPNLAYTVGLFHDCGMPLMMSRFKDYSDVMKLAQLDNSCLITDIEEVRYQTNHAIVGYLLSKNWNLSETISLAVLHHHTLDILFSHEMLPVEVCGLIAVIQIAEALSESILLRDYEAWRANGPMLLSYLGMSEAELYDIIEIARHRPN